LIHTRVKCGRGRVDVAFIHTGYPSKPLVRSAPFANRDRPVNADASRRSLQWRIKRQYNILRWCGAGSFPLSGKMVSATPSKPMQPASLRRSTKRGSNGQTWIITWADQGIDVFPAAQVVLLASSARRKPLLPLRVFAHRQAHVGCNLSRILLLIWAGLRSFHRKNSRTRNTLISKITNSPPLDMARGLIINSRILHSENVRVLQENEAAGRGSYEWDRPQRRSLRSSMLSKSMANASVLPISSGSKLPAL
jgi:hypothetical protein